MKKEGYLTISEFSEIAEVSRKTLIFYDNIGLFSPEYTAENGYRYYSHEQIYIIFVINILKEIGMPLKRIGAFLRQRTPAEAVSLLRQQAGVIDQKIRSLQSFRDMLDIKAERLAEAAETDDSERESEKSAVRLVAQKERFLFLSDPEDVRKTEVPDAVWLRFYMKCKAHGIAIGYPEGFLVKREDFLSGRTERASNIIFHVGDPLYANGVMPAGTYLAVRGRGGFGDTEPLYRRLEEYIAENQHEVMSDVYEERMIDEIGSDSREGQVMEIRVRVR